MVGPATCTEPLTNAGGLLPELAVSTNSMSIPRFLKKPASWARYAELKPVTAV